MLYIMHTRQEKHRCSIYVYHQNNTGKHSPDYHRHLNTNMTLIECCVQEGSISHLLFIMYTVDLSNVIKHHGLRPHHYIL